MKQALNQGDGVSVLVDRRDVHRVGVILVRDLAESGGSTVGVDPGGEVGQAMLVEQLLHRDPHRVGIGHATVPIGNRDPDGLGDGVEIIGGVVAEGLEVDPAQHAELRQQRHSLGVGGEGEDLEVVVGATERLRPNRLVGGEIGGKQEPLALREILDDTPRRFPGVQLVRAVGLEAAQRLGEVGHVEG